MTCVSFVRGAQSRASWQQNQGSLTQVNDCGLATGQFLRCHVLIMLQAAEKSQLADKTKADTARQLLAVVDSFEMAKGQLKPESEGEQKIDGAYQV